MKPYLQILFFLGALSKVIWAVEGPSPREGFAWGAIAGLAIQDRGRVKPLDTFAKESLQFIAGKSSWKGLSAVECIFSWLFAYEGSWDNEPFVRVDYNALKRQIGLSEGRPYFSPQELRDRQELRELVRNAIQKEQRKERLTELEKKALQVQNQLGLLDAVMAGTALNLFPNPEGIDKSWYPLSAVTERSEVTLPYSAGQKNQLGLLLKSLIGAFMENNSKQWNEAAFAFAGFVRNEIAKGAYPSESVLKRELHYNKLRPFRWSWVLYGIAFVLLLLFNVTKSSVWKFVSFSSLILAFGMHAYGFVLRCLIAGRPPVSNMYESVIWVSWGCVLFSLIIWAKYRSAIIPTAATVFAVVGLVLADNLPSVLDPGIHPLEPVLRSNFWLTIHVLTITLSYAAFALSLCLGNVVLGNYLFRPNRTESIQQLTLYMYRAEQIGVILIAAGTILGGVWADYSWGRFWGWDPKEVWALIALLVYLAVLHGRFTGWLEGFGFVVATVLCFLAVLMAWYGVNFVLGVGLHSYGFGTGGLPWVLGYIGLQIVFILGAYGSYKKSKDGTGISAIFPEGRTR